MRAGPGPTCGKRCSSLASVIYIPASLPGSGIPSQSWSISSSRTGPVPRAPLALIVTALSMNGTFSFEACHPPEARTTSVAPASKTVRNAAVIHCDLGH